MSGAVGRWRFAVSMVVRLFIGRWCVETPFLAIACAALAETQMCENQRHPFCLSFSRKAQVLGSNQFCFARLPRPKPPMPAEGPTSHCGPQTSPSSRWARQTRPSCLMRQATREAEAPGNALVLRSLRADSDRTGTLCTSNCGPNTVSPAFCATTATASAWQRSSDPRRVRLARALPALVIDNLASRAPFPLGTRRELFCEPRNAWGEAMDLRWTPSLGSLDSNCQVPAKRDRSLLRLSPDSLIFRLTAPLSKGVLSFQAHSSSLRPTGRLSLKTEPPSKMASYLLRMAWVTLLSWPKH